MRIIMISTAYHGYVHVFAYPIETLAHADHGATTVNEADREEQPQTNAKHTFSSWLAALKGRRSETR